MAQKRLTVKKTAKKRRVRAGQFDGSKPGPGRPPGLQNKATLEGRELAQALVKDPNYVKVLTEKLLAGELDTRLEVMLWHYAYGKPKETVDVNATVLDSRKEEFKQKPLNLGSLAAIEALERKIATALAEIEGVLTHHAGVTGLPRSSDDRRRSRKPDSAGSTRPGVCSLSYSL